MKSRHAWTGESTRPALGAPRRTCPRPSCRTTRRSCSGYRMVRSPARGSPARSRASPTSSSAPRPWRRAPSDGARPTRSRTIRRARSRTRSSSRTRRAAPSGCSIPPSPAAAARRNARSFFGRSRSRPRRRALAPVARSGCRSAVSCARGWWSGMTERGCCRSSSARDCRAPAGPEATTRPRWRSAPIAAQPGRLPTCRSRPAACT